MNPGQESGLDFILEFILCWCYVAERLERHGRHFQGRRLQPCFGQECKGQFAAGKSERPHTCNRKGRPRRDLEQTIHFTAGQPHQVCPVSNDFSRTSGVVLVYIFDPLCLLINGKFGRFKAAMKCNVLNPNSRNLVKLILFHQARHSAVQFTQSQNTVFKISISAKWELSL